MTKNLNKSAMARALTVFGVPDRLVLAGFVFVQSLVSIGLSHVQGWQLEFVWLGLSAIFALLAFQSWDRAYQTSVTGTHLGQDGGSRLASRKGLVILMGLSSHEPTSSIARLLAATGGVEYIALLGTPQTESLGVAEGIRTKLMPVAGVDLPARCVRTWEDDNNAESLADFQNATLEAIEWMKRNGIEVADILVDVSEGRRPMGFGALIAAEQEGVETQYLAYRWDTHTNTAITTEPMFKVVRERALPRPATVNNTQ